MARFTRRAALLSLLALSSVSFSEAGKASGSQCQLAAGNHFYDTCRLDSSGCCPRTVGGSSQTHLMAVDSTGEAGNCCSDSQSNCGDGFSCCSYGTTDQNLNYGWNSGSVEPSSSCIDDSRLKCCQYKILIPGTSSTAAVLKFHRKAYNYHTHDCCTDAIVHRDLTSSNFPVVPKGQSCNYNPAKFTDKASDTQWEEMKKISARCETNADCERGGRTGTCCRRATWSTDSGNDNEFNRKTEDAYGTCVDSGVKCCAGADNKVEIDSNGASTSSDSATVAKVIGKNARAYDDTLEQCCAVTGQVQDKNTGCPCGSDSQCGGGGTCCLENSLNTRECSPSCSQGVSTTATPIIPNGCTGKCSVPGFSTCWTKCGKKEIKEDTDLKDLECCEPTSKDRHVWTAKPAWQSYTCTSTNCCPAGTIGGSAGDITGGTCACWDDGDCNGGWTCCHTEGASKASSYHTAPGRCINPKVSGCCAKQDTDRRIVFNKNSQQCCPMSGPQSIGGDCGCMSDGDCRSGYSCCKDAESSGSYMGKSSSGKCIHSETQECCDNPNKREGVNSVAVCFTEYEKCCNGECCHAELDSCRKVEWAVGENGGRKWVKNTAGVSDAHFKEDQERCQKRMTPAIVFFAWVLPVFLTIFGLAALLGAIKVAFDAAMQERGAKSLRVALIVMAALAHICLTLMLWSMFWQIAIFAMGCNIFIIAVIKTENRWARRMGMLVAFVITVIVVSPYTNNFFSFGVVPHVGSGSSMSVHPMGLQSSLMYHTQEFLNCGKFYQWFTSEQLKPWNLPTSEEWLVDARQHNAKHHTWGLCMWEWQQAIAVIGGLYICFQILFSMAAFAIFSRRMNDDPTPSSKIVDG